MQNLHLPQSRYILPEFRERSANGERIHNPYTKLFEERIIFLGVQIDDASADDVMTVLRAGEIDSVRMTASPPPAACTVSEVPSGKRTTPLSSGLSTSWMYATVPSFDTSGAYAPPVAVGTASEASAASRHASSDASASTSTR